MPDDGVWRTIGGRRVFIRNGQTLDEAMRKSGKFGGTPVLNDTSDDVLGKEFVGLKGQAAIDKLVSEKQGYIKAAFNRDDLGIGDINLVWGEAGERGYGLAHIIERREQQKIDTNNFLSTLGEVIEKGRLYQINDNGNLEILHGSKMAIIALTLRDNKLTFLLTAFKTRKK